MKPPWIKFPEYEAGCLGFRMGDGEDYIDNWFVFWIGLTKKEKESFLKKHTVPSGFEIYCRM